MHFRCGHSIDTWVNFQTNPNKMRYPIKAQDVMKGDLVYKTRESKKTFKYDGYCRLEKKYFASDYDNWNGNGAYFKKDKIVFVEYDGFYEKKGILKCAEYSDLPLNFHVIK